MLVVLVLAFYGSFVLYTRADAGIPRSSFDGRVNIRPSVSGENNGIDVEVTVGEDSFLDGLSHSDGSTRRIEILVDNLHREYAGNDLTVEWKMMRESRMRTFG
jgi:hypothetical protein